jgi:hypothetical protein
MFRAFAATLVVASAVLIPAAGCGAAAETPRAACGVIVDGSGSAEQLGQRTQTVIDAFVTASVCTTVRVIVISANSAGESCTAPTLDLAADMRADPSNQESWSREYHDEQTPRVSALARRLTACVAQHGTGNGTDVFGAFREFARTIPAQGGLVPEMMGWNVIQRYWSETISSRGATYEQLAG